MRGTSDQQIESLVALTPEDLVPQEHPIRRIKPLADRVLQELSPTFSRMYAKGGRPSVPPEHLLKASLLIALYSVRSERQFCERLTYDMLFRWFLDLNIRGGSFDQSTFAKNRTRLLAHEVTGRFFGAVVSEARRQRLLSEEHFSVDGTLLEAWASLKSVRPRDEERDPPTGAGGRNPWKDFRGSGVPTRPMYRRRTRRRCWRARGRGRQRSCPSPATCSWRTGMGWWWTWCCRRLRGRLKRKRR